jgi:hypothetical protein
VGEIGVVHHLFLLPKLACNKADTRLVTYHWIIRQG